MKAASSGRFPYWLDQTCAAAFFGVLAETGRWQGLPVACALLGFAALPQILGREFRGILGFLHWLVKSVISWCLVAAVILIPVGIVLAVLGHGTFETVFRGLGYVAYITFFLNVMKAPVQPRAARAP